MQINFFKFSKNQKERLKKNIFSQFGSLSLVTISTILFPPLMIIFWGIDNFGIWVFLTSIPSLIFFLNINFAESVKQEMVIFNAKGDVEKVKEIFQNGIALVIIKIFIFTIIGYFAYQFKDFDFSATRNLPGNELSIILLCLIISFYLNLFESIFIAGIVFQGKLYIATNIKTITEFSLRIVLILSGIFFESLIYAALIFLLSAILRLLIFFYYYLILKKYLTISLKMVSFKTITRLLKLSISHTLGIFTAILQSSGQIVLLGIFFGPQIIAYISTCKTLFYFMPIRILENTLLAPSYFEYANSFARDKIENLKHNHKRHIMLVLMGLLLFIVGSVALGPFIYNIWLDNKFDLNNIFMLIIIFDVSLRILKNTNIILLRSINKFFKVSGLEFALYSIAMSVSYYLLFLGHSYIVHFMIMLVTTLVILLLSIYFVTKFYKNL